MKVLIVEDEKFAQQRMTELLLDLEPGIQIAAAIDSVENSVKWLSENEVDLILMDIHLSDDISFSIFEQLEIKTPVIFTTAYDKYALRAFKVHSIDYLLKPIDKEELRSSLQKFHRFKTPKRSDIQNIRDAMDSGKEHNYQRRFIVKKGDTIASIKAEEIAYFEGEDRYVYLVNKNGNKFFINHKLSDLESLLDPDMFFKFNRSFIGHFDSIDSIMSVSRSRVKVNLNPSPKRDIIVSTERTREFKVWLNR